MLVHLGKRSVEHDLADALVECHHRIRTFLAMARRLARAPASAVRLEAATQVHRYFTTAFPLHLADETDLIGELPDNAAMHRMQADHVDHAPAIERLVALMAQVMRDPADHTVDEELVRVADHACELLEPHLALEETEIFPAVRRLSEAVVSRLRAEMRARRLR